MKRAKFLSLLLTFAMLLSLVSIPALAADDTADQPTEKTETTGETTASKTFEDVTDHWGKASVERWAGYGVLNGDPAGNFNPDAQMTRAEFATMLVNMLGYTEKAENTFADVPADAWFADAVLKLAAAGVMKGDGTNANPNAPISRQEAAVLLCRAFNIAPSKDAKIDFADGEAVADWASDAVAALTERGMIAGVGENNFAPVANITRASVAKLADNMVAEYVTADKEITGEVKGLVVVAGEAEVTIKDAKLSENVIVAPKAGEAEVTLTGKTTAGNIYVQSDASAVKVKKDATAASVLVDASKASVEVAGKVESIMTTETAAEAAVTVAKGATVDAVALAGEDAKLDVTGTVKDVEVSSTAKGADIVANQGAKITNVTTSAEDVKVSGKGTVSNVTANAGSADVTTKGTKVKNDGADKVTAGGKEVADGKTSTTPGGSTGGGGGGNSGSSVKDSDITGIAAPTQAQYTAAFSGWDNAPALNNVALNYTQNGTKIVAKGDLTYVENFTGFNVPEEANGYYAALYIPLPDSVKVVESDVIWYSKDLSKSNKGIDFKEDDQANLTLIVYLGNEANAVPKDITFKVDLDGTGSDYRATTYTIDMSAVNLLDKSIVRGPQSVAIRDNKEGDSVDYVAGYRNVGTTLTDTTYTIDGKTLETYVTNSANNAAVDGLCRDDSIYLGVAFSTPTVSDVTLDKVEMYIDGVKADEAALDDAGVMVNGKYVTYFGIAKVNEAEGTRTVTFLPEKTWNLSFKWYAGDELKAFTDTTLTRTTELTVTLKPGYGEGGDTTETVTYGETIAEIPTREGYTFTGWKLEDQAFDGPVTANITLTAQWKIKSTVSTAAELEKALELAEDNAVITVDGTIGSESDFASFVVKKPVTIKGAENNKVYASFIVVADGAKFEDLTVYNKGGDAEYKNAINAYCADITITGCTFEMGVKDAFGNGVVIFPSKSDVKYEISGNTFDGYKKSEGGYSSSALVITGAYTMSGKPFFDATGVTVAANAAKAVMSATEDEAMVTGNSYNNCKIDYCRNTWTENNTVNTVYATSVSNGSNTRFANAAEDGAVYYITGKVTRTTDSDPDALVVKEKSEVIITEDGTLTIDADVELTVNGTVTGALVGTDATSKLTIGAKGSYGDLEKGTYTWINDSWGNGPIELTVESVSQAVVDDDNAPDNKDSVNEMMDAMWGTEETEVQGITVAPIFSWAENTLTINKEHVTEEILQWIKTQWGGTSLPVKLTFVEDLEGVSGDATFSNAYLAWIDMEAVEGDEASAKYNKGSYVTTFAIDVVIKTVVTPPDAGGGGGGATEG